MTTRAFLQLIFHERNSSDITSQSYQPTISYVNQDFQQLSNQRRKHLVEVSLSETAEALASSDIKKQLALRAN